jgi:hypothetical protein
VPPDTATRYRFTGSAPKGFYSYADLDGTGMLIAQPGQDYAIRALEENLPVPPSSSEWEPVAPPTAKAAKSTEGGE